MSLPIEQYSHLVPLKADSDAKRLALAKALTQHRANLLSLAKLREQSKAAHKAYQEAYRAAGLSRQQAYQVCRQADGKCRQCGAPSERSRCPACLEKNSWKNRRKK